MTTLILLLFFFSCSFSKEPTVLPTSRLDCTKQGLRNTRIHTMDYQSLKSNNKEKTVCNNVEIQKKEFTDKLFIENVEKNSTKTDKISYSEIMNLDSKKIVGCVNNFDMLAKKSKGNDLNTTKNTLTGLAQKNFNKKGKIVYKKKEAGVGGMFTIPSLTMLTIFMTYLATSGYSLFITSAGIAIPIILGMILLNSMLII